MDDIMQMHAWAYEIATGNGIQTKCRLGDGYGEWIKYHVLLCSTLKGNKHHTGVNYAMCMNNRLKPRNYDGKTKNES